MADINIYIYNKINSICDCYIGHAPMSKQEQYPYAEIKFPNIITNNETSNSYLLEIDIWDNKTNDPREIDNIAKQMFSVLENQRIITDDNFLILINRNTPCVINLVDPEPSLQRKQLRFIVTVYSGSLEII